MVGHSQLFITQYRFSNQFNGFGENILMISYYYNPLARYRDTLSMINNISDRVNGINIRSRYIYIMDKRVSFFKTRRTIFFVTLYHSTLNGALVV